MVRNYAFIVTVGAALAASAAVGCSFKAAAGANTGGQEPPPPPPPPPPPAAEPAPAPTAKPEPAPAPVKVPVADAKGKIAIPGNIVFDTGQATLTPNSGSEDVLKQLKAYLDANPRVTKIRVEGHTDNVGKPADNAKLSGERALTIKRWLVEQGVAKERVIAAGFGQDKPIADNGTDAGKAQNRRTEFHIAELDGKKYLGMDPTRGGKVFDL